MSSLGLGLNTDDKLKWISHTEGVLQKLKRFDSQNLRNIIHNRKGTFLRGMTRFE